MKNFRLLALAAVAAGAAASAQTNVRRDPLDPQARVPVVEYRSAFENYQPYRDAPVVNWREANEEVRSIGGHAGHLANPAEASGPARKPEPKGSSPEETPKPGRHGGHRL